MEVCNGNGDGLIYQFCDVSAPVCVDGECQALVCSPGTRRCKGVAAVESCLDNGSGWQLEQLCGVGGLCKDATCVTACDLDVKNNTYVG